MYKTLISTLLFLMLNGIAFGQLDFSQVNSSTYPLLQKMDSSVTAGTYERITSIVIAKDGKVLFEKYYNGADVNSKHNTRSVTKTMATLATGMAIDKGFITSEKDPIYKYLKHKWPVENPDPRKRTMTLEDLLTMSSLMECNDNNSFSRGNEERMYIVEDWLQFFLDLPIKSFPFGPKPEKQPYGRSFAYCTAGAAAMAEVVQSATKTPTDQFLKENLLTPLGITDYTMHYTPSGTLNTAGGSDYRSRDFLKIIQMCLQNGQWNGNQIISSSWIQKATTPKVNAWPGMDYGYLFWLPSFGSKEKTPAFAMSGNGGNRMTALPELNATVVVTTTNYGNRNAHNYVDELLNSYIVPTLIKY